MIENNYNEIKSKLYDKLMSSGSERALARYYHSLNVAKESVILIERFNLDVDKNKAYLAGLIHDYAKFVSIEDFRKIASKYEPNFDFTKNSNNVIHALLGCYIVKEELNLDDDICQAVRTHSTGSKNMSPLQEVIFLADYTEESREKPICLKAREIAKTNFYKAIAYALEKQIEIIISKNNYLNEETVEAYLTYQKYLKEEK